MELELRLRVDTNIVGRPNQLAENFSSLQAGGADVLALGITVNESANSLNIWIPTAASTAL
jgi:hypothetical protein